MDLIKVGEFIAQCRKAKALTQRDVAAGLCVTDRAVSKWECGKGLPDVSLMMPLCDMLGISINELLSGEKIAEQEASARAEQQLVDLLIERQENKKKIWLCVFISFVGIFVCIAAIMLSAYFLEDILIRSVTVVFGVIIMAACLIVTLIIDRATGSYECSNCKKRFVPDMKAYTLSTQMITKRKMTCPHCGVRNWCKRKLNK